MMQSASIRSFLAAIAMGCLCGMADADEFSYDPYGRVLDEFVSEAGRVRYPDLVNHRDDLDQFVRHLAELDRTTYRGWPTDRQLAFWMNAYNALTLKAVADHYPIESIRDIGNILASVWDKLKFMVMGEQLTLNDIEHEILRKQFDEPRIHMAINCASIGCPPLASEILRAETLEEQFAHLTRGFLADPGKFRMDRSAGMVHLSPIFKWFGKDFVASDTSAGELPGLSAKESAVVRFIAMHLEPTDQAYLLSGRYRIKYLPYDWGLNEAGSTSR